MRHKAATAARTAQKGPAAGSNGSGVSAPSRAQPGSLRRELDFTAAVVANAGVLVCVTDQDGRIVRFNRACEVLTGYSFEEVRGRRFWDVLISPPGIPRIRELALSLTRDQLPLFSEDELWTRSGERRRIAWTVTALLGPGREIEYIVGTGLDVTDRRRAEDALREREEKYRSLVESIEETHFIYAHNINGVFTYLSPSISKILGYTPEEFLTHYTRHLTAHPVNLEVVRHTDLSIRGIRQPPYEVEIYHKDGSIRWLEVSETPVFDAGGRVIAVQGIAREVTGRKRADEELRRLNEDLDRRVAERTSALAEANRELEAFSYTVSHDLRAPLRAINAFSGILENDYRTRLDGEASRLLGVIRDNTLRMSQLIDDLLSFARIGQQEVGGESVEMESLARSVAEELARAEPERRVQVEWDSLPVVRGDRALLRQVWVNLLGNAWKFTRPRDEPKVRIGAETQGPDLVFRVEDNGVGFDEQYVHRLFGMFERLHGLKEFEGTGVGLAIVRRIISRHGGKVGAEGRPGKGAAFWFSLPAARSGGSAIRSTAG
ncbi:MAG: PAS domain S-box protein [Planctomycetes bacterium]|nr:PAS domain S-box protein [Planctomycetota bacterium]